MHQLAHLMLAGDVVVMKRERMTCSELQASRVVKCFVLPCLSSNLYITPRLAGCLAGHDNFPIALNTLGNNAVLRTLPK